MIIDSIWAKTVSLFDGTTADDEAWMSLHQHLRDTAGIASILWDDFWPNQIKNTLSKELGSYSLSKNLYVFLSGIHDVGKCSPGFENMARDEHPYLLNSVEDALGIDIPINAKNSSCRHESTGYVALLSWLIDRGMDSDTAKTIATVIGGHHGVFSSTTMDIERQLHSRRGGDVSSSTAYGTAHQWLDARSEIITTMSNELNTDIDSLLHLTKLPLAIQSMLTGMVIVADWMASDQNLFSLDDSGSYHGNQNERVRKSWDSLNLPSPWSMKNANIGNPDVFFHRRFGIPDVFHINELQKYVLKKSATDDVDLMIIEAPMGIGKTEAALLAAEQMARRKGSGGIVFALPTQATANGIFPRLKQWIYHVSDGSESLRLLHGNASLNSDVEHMRKREWRVKTYGDNNDAIRAPDWFNGSKQGILSNFVVCTIDQILMAALQQKHFMLRHIGLAGKVIIVDEVHASDTYMEVYMERALQWLSSMNCSVILLSATLDDSRRNSLIKAYAEGQGRFDISVPDAHNSYPLISTYHHAIDMYTPSVRNDSTNIHIHSLSDSPANLLQRLLADGGCAAVIHNTVREAQETYNDFIEKGWDSSELMLFHSRFTPTDRSRLEQAIMSRLGRNGERPHKIVVIATQVIEQSLDIDFDVMISDMAPIDLILQRAGRLHRHHREHRPYMLKEPSMYLRGYQTDTEKPIKTDKIHGMIYGSSRLIRANTVLLGHDDITIPHDIPYLVNESCSPDIVFPDMWREVAEKADNDYHAKMVHKHDMAERTLLWRPHEKVNTMLASNSGGRALDEQHARAAVRDSLSGISVIALNRHADGSISMFNEDDILSTVHIDNNIAAGMARQRLTLPNALSNKNIIDRTISELEENRILAWQDSPFLNGELILFFDDGGTAHLCGYTIHYDGIYGLRYTRDVS